MTEVEFWESIKCKFPYLDNNKGKKIVDDAIKLSDVSVFGVIHELVRPPKSAKYSKKNALELLKYIDIIFKHKFKRQLIDISEKSISGNLITEEEVLNLMEETKKYKWLSLPLNILYFLIDDEEGKIEKKYEEVLEHWRKKYGKGKK